MYAGVSAVLTLRYMYTRVAWRHPAAAAAAARWRDRWLVAPLALVAVVGMAIAHVGVGTEVRCTQPACFNLELEMWKTLLHCYNSPPADVGCCVLAWPAD